MRGVNTHGGLSLQVDELFSLSHSQDPTGGKKKSNDGMLLDYWYFNYI